MSRKQLIVILILGVCIFLSLNSALAEIIYPISSKEELQSLVRELNKQNIKMSDWYYDEDINPGADKTLEKVESVVENGEFFIEGANGGFKFFKIDINNDGADEYVKTLEVGSGRFFDIEAVYKTVSGKFVDIYGELKLPMRKLIRDTDNETYDLEDGYPGHAFGDIIVERKNKQIYFSIITARESGRSWEDINSFNVSKKPRTYEFLWAHKEIKLTRVYDRLLEKKDFFK